MTKLHVTIKYTPKDLPADTLKRRAWLNLQEAEWRQELIVADFEETDPDFTVSAKLVEEGT